MIARKLAEYLTAAKREIGSLSLKRQAFSPISPNCSLHSKKSELRPEPQPYGSLGVARIFRGREQLRLAAML